MGKQLLSSAYDVFSCYTYLIVNLFVFFFTSVFGVGIFF